MDIVYPVGPGRHEELRYSLRSLENIPHDKVWLVGDPPAWSQQTNNLRRDQSNLPPQSNSNANLFYAALQDDLSDDFIFMNTDFFIMQPTETVPNMHMGSLDDLIQRYETGNRFHQAYSLITTRNWLLKHGYGPDLLSYELHMPMVFNKHKVVQLIRDFTKTQALFTLRPRTCYGNAYNLNGEMVNDAKNSSDTEACFISGTDFGADDRAAKLVRQRFTNPGPYEP